MAPWFAYIYDLVIARPQAVAISWYDLPNYTALSGIVPGDSHVASLLGMTWKRQDCTNFTNSARSVALK